MRKIFIAIGAETMIVGIPFLVNPEWASENALLIVLFGLVFLCLGLIYDTSIFTARKNRELQASQVASGWERIAADIISTLAEYDADYSTFHMLRSVPDATEEIRRQLWDIEGRIEQERSGRKKATLHRRHHVDLLRAGGEILVMFGEKNITNRHDVDFAFMVNDHTWRDAASTLIKYAAKVHLMDLKKARESGKMKDFIKEHESEPEGDLDKLDALIKRPTQGSEKATRQASPRESSDD